MPLVDARVFRERDKVTFIVDSRVFAFEIISTRRSKIHIYTEKKKSSTRFSPVASVEPFVARRTPYIMYTSVYTHTNC